MARKKKGMDAKVDTHTPRRARPVQGSPIYHTKPSKRAMSMRCQELRALSPSLGPSVSPERRRTGEEFIFWDEPNPLQALNCLEVDATKPTLPAPFAEMAIDSSDPELNGADLVHHVDHDPPDFGRKTDEMPLGEHWDGREPAGQKHKGNSEEPNGADHAPELTESEEDRDDTEEPRYGVEAIIGHTIYEETKVNLHVKWIDYPERTLVDECIIQQDCPAMLYKYWGSCGTREKATGIESSFHPFRICDWRVKKKGKLELKVHWVGYPPRKSTWEPASSVEESAKEIHKRYLDTHPAAKRVWEMST